MASNRIGRINEEIQKELSSLIRNLKDPRVQNTMISITRVEATPDLRYAKIFVGPTIVKLYSAFSPQTFKFSSVQNIKSAVFLVAVTVTCAPFATFKVQFPPLCLTAPSTITSTFPLPE